MRQKDRRANSLLSQYQRLLEGESINECDELEQRHVQEMPLKHLDLESAPIAIARSEGFKPKNEAAGRKGLGQGHWNRPIWGWVAAVATAAAMLLMLHQTPERDAVMVAKGGFVVTVYAKNHDDVRQLSALDSAQEGDAIRVQIQAPQGGTAFWAITNAEGVVISDLDRIEDDRLEVNPAEPATFPGSFEIYGDNDGETLVVLFCKSVTGFDSGSSAMLKAFVERPHATPGCLKFIQPLRRR